MRVRLAASCLNGFVRRMRPGYMMGWVHKAICHELDLFLREVEAKRGPRLLICLPPRAGKSELVSRCLPAYILGRDPDAGIIATSYSADLAMRNNRDVQRIIDSDRYREVFPGTELWGKNVRTVADGACLRNGDIFEVVGRRGSYRSAGVGGGITGMGGEYLLIDDPIKNRKEAYSHTYREAVWDWYTSTLYTRLSPGGGIILIQTRWHMDDLAGRLLAAAESGEGEKWKVLSFPAIATRDEEHRREGEALHPERYDLSMLERMRKAIGTRDWEALYQQRPVPDGGQVFKKEWMRRWASPPSKFDKVIASWDMAFKDDPDSDYVVGQIWGKKGADVYLLDQVRGRMSFTETVEAFKALAEKWPEALEKLVEDAANGPAVIDSLKRRLPGIIPVRPEGGKVARAYSITPAWEAGNVHIPEPVVRPWARDFEAELLQFPAGANDDQVDAMTQALNRLLNRGFVKPEIFSGGLRATSAHPWGGAML